MTARFCNRCNHWDPVDKTADINQGLCRRLAGSSRFDGWPVTEAGDTCDEWIESGLYKGKDGAILIDRRTTARTPVDRPARLQTAGGDWSVRLADISLGGARLELANPPRTGAQALLKWNAQEVMCKIAWSRSGVCGVTFDKPISHELLAETTGMSELVAAVTGDMRRIPLGKRRSRRQQAG